MGQKVQMIPLELLIVATVLKSQVNARLLMDYRSARQPDPAKLQRLVFNNVWTVWLWRENEKYLQSFPCCLSWTRCRACGNRPLLTTPLTALDWWWQLDSPPTLFYQLPNPLLEPFPSSSLRPEPPSPGPVWLRWTLTGRLVYKVRSSLLPNWRNAKFSWSVMLSVCWTVDWKSWIRFLPTMSETCLNPSTPSSASQVLFLDSTTRTVELLR